MSNRLRDLEEGRGVRRSGAIGGEHQIRALALVGCDVPAVEHPQHEELAQRRWTIERLA